MTPELTHVAMIVANAALAGYCTSRRDYGWAVTYSLMFFAVLKY